MTNSNPTRTAAPGAATASDSVPTITAKIVVIAGASSASGRAVAAQLKDAGAIVVAVGSNAERLRDVASSASYVCDLADPAAVLDLAQRVHTEVGPVDGLVHLVGGWKAGHDDESWAWLEQRIVTTLRNTTIAFRDDLVASPAGRLAIVSSTSVAKPTWSNANYATAKAAAEAWVEAVASGWAKKGTAAAVTFRVTALGDNAGATSVGRLAEAIVALWLRPSAELNHALIELDANPAPTPGE
jgi:NAD(P)-dependent dehydrogenase (short-subunit alcohol dehydrogenase family)